MSNTMTREEIMKRLEIEDQRIASADKNIEALLKQRERCLAEQQRLLNLLAELERPVT